jgi:hypothetical protein
MVQYYKVDGDDGSDGALARQLELRGVRVSNREPDAGPVLVSLVTCILYYRDGTSKVPTSATGQNIVPSL